MAGSAAATNVADTTGKRHHGEQLRQSGDHLGDLRRLHRHPGGHRHQLRGQDRGGQRHRYLAADLHRQGRGDLYLASATDVELESPTQFTVVLAGADKTNVDCPVGRQRHHVVGHHALQSGRRRQLGGRSGGGPGHRRRQPTESRSPASPRHQRHPAQPRQQQGGDEPGDNVLRAAKGTTRPVRSTRCAGGDVRRRRRRRQRRDQFGPRQRPASGAHPAANTAPTPGATAGPSQPSSQPPSLFTGGSTLDNPGGVDVMSIVHNAP